MRILSLSEAERFPSFWDHEEKDMCASVLSRVWLFATPWNVIHQASLSMGFPRQEYWSGLPFPPPRDLPNPGIKLESPVLPTLHTDFSQPSHQRSLYEENRALIYFLNCLGHVWNSLNYVSKSIDLIFSFVYILQIKIRTCYSHLPKNK